MLRSGDMEGIRELHRHGLSVMDIQRETGYDRKTIRKYLQETEAPEYGPRTPPPSILDPYKPYLEERLKAGVWNATVLLRELKGRGFPGQYTVVREFVQVRRKAAKETAVRRFETPAGYQAQVDWGDLGVLEAGGERKRLSGFVLTLGHSRAMFCAIATDQRLETLLYLHEQAFEALGGVTKEILYDNMRTVTSGRNSRDEVEWHPVFKDFARHWGFEPRVCRPYRPQTKGKVESGVGYLKGNFLPGRAADGLRDLQGQLRVWLWDVANRRVHGTTHRVVGEAWEEEKPFLLPLRSLYAYCPEERRKVSRDAYLHYKSNRYSVPWEAAGTAVGVREVDGRLEILEGSGGVITSHPLCRERRQVLTQVSHHAGIPLGGDRRPSGTKLYLVEGAPEVEVRDLSVYDTYAREGNGSSSLTAVSMPLWAGRGGER